MKKVIRRIPHWGKCALIFCFAELLVSVAYPFIKEQAMQGRAKAVPGGEMLLWLLGFILAFAYDTYRKGKEGKSSGEHARKDIRKSRVRSYGGRSF